MALRDALNLTMRAVAYYGTPYEMVVDTIPVPQIQNSTDAIVRVTTAAICGSDLHYYHGTYGHGTTPPWYMGHEAVGYVASIGGAVNAVAQGDYVVIPDITAGPNHFDLTDTLGPAFGGGGELGGCQAEYVRVPYADDNLFIIPSNVSGLSTNITTDSSIAQDLDWLMLSDVFNTGWAGLDYAGFQPGDTVAIFGAGPVGLMSAYSAIIRGASKVYVIDHVESRLQLAKHIGAIPINFRDGDPVEQILAHEPEGVARTVDCVGYEAVNANLDHEENVILNQMIRLTMQNGGLGGIGVWGTAHQNDTVTTAGALVTPNITIDMGSFWGKRLSLRSGGVDALELTGKLAELIRTGVAHPGFVFSEVVGIEEAPAAYARFDQHLTEKVAIHFPWR